MNDLEEYIEHCAGFYDFLAWLEKNTIKGFQYQISNQIIYLNPLVSRYFSLGVSSAKKLRKNPFLAMQPSEAEWFKLIKWNRIVLRHSDNHIYFIAETIHGDGENYPDIPSFAVGLFVDTKEKMDLLKNLSTLVGREYYKDDTDEVHINFHKKLFTLPITQCEKNDQIVSLENILDYSQILAMKEQGISAIYSERPEFMGEIGNVAGTDSLMKKWKNKEV